MVQYHGYVKSESGVDGTGAAGADIIEIELPRVFERALDSFRVISLRGAHAIEREMREQLDTMNPWLKGQRGKAAIDHEGPL